MTRFDGWNWAKLSGRCDPRETIRAILAVAFRVLSAENQFHYAQTNETSAQRDTRGPWRRGQSRPECAGGAADRSQLDLHVCQLE